jgi:hypothetical protein
MGFETTAVPMSTGTPFANVLVVARPRIAPAARRDPDNPGGD